MESFFQRISQSSHEDHWRRFRLPADALTTLLELARAVGGEVRELRREGAVPTLIELRGGEGDFLIAEFARYSPSPIAMPLPAYAIAFTDSREAIRECHGWLGERGAENGAAKKTESVLAKLLRREEQVAWIELERRILQAVQAMNPPELDGESLLFDLHRTVGFLFAPDLTDLHLESPGDFWPGRNGEWSWSLPSADEPAIPLTLTPRLQRLLYRRDRFMFIEDLAAAPDVQVESSRRDGRFASALLLPFLAEGKPLGILSLVYRSAIVPLPGEVEAIERFRREVAATLERCRMHLKMQRLATVDGLTGLFNHRFFREQLRTEYQRALRYHKMMALIMLDIDGFKGYNDTFGHLAGDRVLAETARTIRDAVRDIDFVARYGGEEFALILPEVDAASGMIVAEKIRKAVEAQRFISEDGEAIGTITVSCGVTDNGGAGSPEELIQRADRALYWVKRNGRNLVKLAALESDE